jgi:hypothetical protein
LLIFDDIHQASELISRDGTFHQAFAGQITAKMFVPMLWRLKKNKHPSLWTFPTKSTMALASTIDASRSRGNCKCKSSWPPKKTARRKIGVLTDLFL